MRGNVIKDQIEKDIKEWEEEWRKIEKDTKSGADRKKRRNFFALLYNLLWGIKTLLFISLNRRQIK